MSLVIRGTTIATPYFLAPINTGFCVNGEPDGRLIRFHRDRSGKGIGIAYVGNVSIGDQYRSNAGTLVLSQATASWKELSSTIRENGSVAAIQIACKLSGGKPNLKWRNPVPRDYIASIQDYIVKLEIGDIERTCDLFIETACRAADAGFELIQIHSAHGYFLSQLLSARLNRRTDKFGAASIMALAQIVGGIRDRLPGIMIDVRLSILDGIEPKEIELPQRLDQIRLLTELDVDLISLSAGLYEIDRFMIYPKIEDGHAVYYDYVNSLEIEYPKVTWNVAGNIWDVRKLDDKGKNLTYSIGRALIADPDFVLKTISGRANEISECIRSGHCHYYTRGQPHISCKVNTRL